MGQEDRKREGPFGVDPKLQPNAALPLNRNGDGSVAAEPTLTDVRTTIGADFGRQVVDAVSRQTRLTIAAVITTALLLLWGSMAYLRSEARQLEPAPAAAAVGLISSTVDAKQNPVPSNAVPFALISYGVVLLEIGIAWAYHDPFSHQLRAIERRSRRSKTQANKEQSRVR